MFFSKPKIGTKLLLHMIFTKQENYPKLRGLKKQLFKEICHRYFDSFRGQYKIEYPLLGNGASSTGI